MVDREMDGTVALSLLSAASCRSPGAVDAFPILGVGNGGIALGNLPKRHGGHGEATT
jgi:hypothetical protein